MSNPPPPPAAPDEGGSQIPPAAPTPPAQPSQPYGTPATPSYGQQTYGTPQQSYQQPSYGQPAAYGNPGYTAVATPRNNPLAIAALITACGGVFVWVLAPIAGAIMGHIALGQIKRTGENGRGMALAGVLVGWILAGLQLIGIILYFVFIAVVIASGSAYDSYSG